MEFWNYIVDNALIMIPALIILGMIIKQVSVIPDKFIPLILLVFGVAGGLLMCGLSVDGVIQGVLVTGAAVYGNQLVKQLKKKEEPAQPVQTDPVTVEADPAELEMDDDNPHH